MSSWALLDDLAVGQAIERHALRDDRLPYRRVGTHRRLRVEDVLAYREQRAEKRREKLCELTRLSEEAEGSYR